MSKTITLPDQLHANLSQRAQQHGYPDIVSFIKSWDLAEQELDRRRHLSEQLKQLRKRTYERHCMMPDSVPLIREDRER